MTSSDVRLLITLVDRLGIPVWGRQEVIRAAFEETTGARIASIADPAEQALQLAQWMDTTILHFALDHAWAWTAHHRLNRMRIAWRCPDDARLPISALADAIAFARSADLLDEHGWPMHWSDHHRQTALRRSDSHSNLCWIDLSPTRLRDSPVALLRSAISGFTAACLLGLTETQQWLRSWLRHRLGTASGMNLAAEMGWSIAIAEALDDDHLRRDYTIAAQRAWESCLESDTPLIMAPFSVRNFGRSLLCTPWHVIPWMEYSPRARAAVALALRDCETPLCRAIGQAMAVRVTQWIVEHDAVPSAFPAWHVLDGTTIMQLHGRYYQQLRSRSAAHYVLESRRDEVVAFCWNPSIRRLQSLAAGESLWVHDCNAAVMNAFVLSCLPDDMLIAAYDMLRATTTAWHWQAACAFVAGTPIWDADACAHGLQMTPWACDETTLRMIAHGSMQIATALRVMCDRDDGRIDCDDDERAVNLERSSDRLEIQQRTFLANCIPPWLSHDHDQQHANTTLSAHHAASNEPSNAAANLSNHNHAPRSDTDGTPLREYLEEAVASLRLFYHPEKSAAALSDAMLAYHDSDRAIDWIAALITGNDDRAFRWMVADSWLRNAPARLPSLLETQIRQSTLASPQELTRCISRAATWLQTLDQFGFSCDESWFPVLHMLVQAATSRHAYDLSDMLSSSMIFIAHWTRHQRDIVQMVNRTLSPRLCARIACCFPDSPPARERLIAIASSMWSLPMARYEAIGWVGWMGMGHSIRIPCMFWRMLPHVFRYVTGTWNSADDERRMRWLATLPNHWRAAIPVLSAWKDHDAVANSAACICRATS